MTEQDSKNSGETAVAAPNERASWKQMSVMLLVALLILILDQATKFIIEANVTYNTSWMPLEWLAPFFQITHIGNTGIAFGLFAGGSMIFALVAMVVTAVLLFYNYTLPAGHIGVRIVLGVILGGALGNLLDRLRLGYVTDFLDFGPWPVFNVADMAVVFGSIALVWLMWQEEKKFKAAADAEAQQTAPRGEQRDEQPAN
jgi:signal peptidase II